MIINELVHDTPIILITTHEFCLDNPGPGGWGAVLQTETPQGMRTKALQGGDPETTDHRMALTAVVEAFRMLKTASEVYVMTPSHYVVEAFEHSWIGVARSHGRSGDLHNDTDDPNADLWQNLLTVTAPHDITWEWTGGHQSAASEQAETLALHEAFEVRSASLPSGDAIDLSAMIAPIFDDPTSRARLVEYLRTHPDQWAHLHSAMHHFPEEES